MKQTARAADRLANKSDAHPLIHNLVSRYDMSVAEAECLADELCHPLADTEPARSLIDAPGGLLAQASA